MPCLQGKQNSDGKIGYTVCVYWKRKTGMRESKKILLRRCLFVTVAFLFKGTSPLPSGHGRVRKTKTTTMATIFISALLIDIPTHISCTSEVSIMGFFGTRM